VRVRVTNREAHERQGFRTELELENGAAAPSGKPFNWRSSAAEAERFEVLGLPERQVAETPRRATHDQDASSVLGATAPVRSMTSFTSRVRRTVSASFRGRQQRAAAGGGRRSSAGGVRESSDTSPALVRGRTRIGDRRFGPLFRRRVTRSDALTRWKRLRSRQSYVFAKSPAPSLAWVEGRGEDDASDVRAAALPSDRPLSRAWADM